jgi:hypothetical protein
MGYYANGIDVKPSFQPNDIMTRAEVGVVLSRMLRGNKQAGTEEDWFQKHLNALREEDIMRFIDTPMMLELRGNILIMLWRMTIR